MRLIHKVCVVCKQGSTCYSVGTKLKGGIVDKIEDESQLDKVFEYYEKGEII